MDGRPLALFTRWNPRHLAPSSYTRYHSSSYTEMDKLAKNRDDCDGRKAVGFTHATRIF